MRSTMAFPNCPGTQVGCCPTGLGSLTTPFPFPLPSRPKNTLLSPKGSDKPKLNTFFNTISPLSKEKDTAAATVFSALAREQPSTARNGRHHGFYSNRAPKRVPQVTGWIQQAWSVGDCLTMVLTTPALSELLSAQPRGNANLEPMGTGSAARPYQFAGTNQAAAAANWRSARPQIPSNAPPTAGPPVAGPSPRHHGS